MDEQYKNTFNLINDARIQFQQRGVNEMLEMTDG